MNAVIRALTFSDVVILGSRNLLAPVFAIFVIDNIEGGNAAVAGTAVAVYLIVKAILQIPIARFTDRFNGETDDFLFLFLGVLIGGVLPLGYLVSTLPWHLYFFEALIGITDACAYPTYMAIFGRHIDRRRQSTTWGTRFTMLDVMSAATAVAGGVLAVFIGFPVVIIGHVILNVLGSLFLIPAWRFMKSKRA